MRWGIGRSVGLGLAVFVLLGYTTGQKPEPYDFPEIGHFPKMPVNPDNPVTVEGVELGRYLFYDPSLSRDSSISCSSCHLQSFAFSDGGRQFSIGIDAVETERNTMPLFNLAWYRGMFWDGRAETIEEQVLHPVRDKLEMDLNWKEAEVRLGQSKLYPELFLRAFGTSKIDSNQVSLAIAQFLRTLISSNSKYDSVIRGEAYFSETEYKGFELVNDQAMAACVHCHNTDAHVLGTTGGFSNNGIDSALTESDYADVGRSMVTGLATDVGLFRVPSLRNVMVTAPYMHDGRFATLGEVLDFYSNGVHVSFNIDSKMVHAHKGGVGLTVSEKESILAFLNTLTDYSFLNNPELGNPHTFSKTHSSRN